MQIAMIVILIVLLVLQVILLGVTCYAAGSFFKWRDQEWEVYRDNLKNSVISWLEVNNDELLRRISFRTDSLKTDIESKLQGLVKIFGEHDDMRMSIVINTAVDTMLEELGVIKRTVETKPGEIKRVLKNNVTLRRKK